MFLVIVLGVALGVGHEPTRVASNNATPPQTTAPAAPPTMPGLDPAAVTSSQSAVTQPHNLLERSRHKGPLFCLNDPPRSTEQHSHHQCCADEYDCREHQHAVEQG